MAVEVTSTGGRAGDRAAPRDRAMPGDRAVPGFAPIQQLRAHEYVAEQVRRHIALRLIGPGESLPSERELATTFGVGRPTVQHALRLLEADHLVEARRGRRGGTFVSEPAGSAGAMDELLARVLRRRKELEEVLIYRRAIEPRVAAEAARARARGDLTAISRAVAGMSHAGSEPDYMRHDTEFHLAIARATRNRFMLGAIEDVRLRLNDAMSLLPESDTWHRRLSGEHDAIVRRSGPRRESGRASDGPPRRGQRGERARGAERNREEAREMKWPWCPRTWLMSHTSRPEHGIVGWQRTPLLDRGGLGARTHSRSWTWSAITTALHSPSRCCSR